MMHPMRLREIRIALVAIFALVTLLVPAGARAADPVGIGSCPGVRPGALVSANGTDFTMGFLYKGSDKNRYIATVADPVLTRDGTKVWKKATGPTARDSNGKKIGTFAYARITGVDVTEQKEYTTFSLIRLSSSTKANPSVCHFGGPTGTHTSYATSPAVLNFYGQDIEYILVPARSAIAPFGTPSKTWIYMAGPQGVLDVGDWGAPVLIGGKAAGIITLGLGFQVDPDVPSVQAGATVARIAPWIATAQKALHIKLSLMTARTA